MTAERSLLDHAIEEVGSGDPPPADPGILPESDRTFADTAASPKAKKPGGPGRRFKAGESGNPSGLPKRQRPLAERARKLTPEIMRSLKAIARNAKHPRHYDALALLLAYGYGRPAQVSHVAVATISQGDRPDIWAMTSSEQRAELMELERRRAAAERTEHKEGALLSAITPDAIEPPSRTDDR